MQDRNGVSGDIKMDKTSRHNVISGCGELADGSVRIAMTMCVPVFRVGKRGDKAGLGLGQLMTLRTIARVLLYPHNLAISEGASSLGSNSIRYLKFVRFFTSRLPRENLSIVSEPV